MNISIITVGKLKEKYMREAVEEYSKRLSKYCKLEIIEVADEKAPEHMSPAEEVIVRDREGQGILKHIKDDAYVVALAIEGKMMGSGKFAEFIGNLGVRGKSNVVFVIGGSIGLSDGVMRRADFELSFSPMTFPHQLMRVVLLEQVYRGFRIGRGEPYHK